MSYVEIQAEKSEGRGHAVGNGWQDTDDVCAAVTAEFKKFHRTWDALGHGAAVTYRITVAPESSPRRSTRRGWPLPVQGVK
jgi:hypothetical protein